MELRYFDNHTNFNKYVATNASGLKIVKCVFMADLCNIEFQKIN